MTEVKDCLPENARGYFINLRNVRQEAATEKYQAQLAEIRGQMAANGLAPSGMQRAHEWRVKEEHLESLATEYVQAAIETCNLYDIPLTPLMCSCFIKAAGEFLDVQFGYLLNSQAKGIADVRVPLSVIQQGNHRSIKIMNRIKLAVETARVQDSKQRSAMAKEKESPQVLYNVSGPNARINIQSTDLSTNIVNVESAALFDNLRNVIQESIQDADAAKRLSEQVDAMQVAAGTKTFLAAYQQFVSMAADHLTLFLPFVPALTQLLS
ncbi:MAG TPA: hypothetical protein VFK06_22565 [Candidatus Angelobacter sp.]|nr:hypothetical protein [Candidatus Angelobacter sp.]